MSNQPQVFVTGKYWLGGGARAIGPALLEIIDAATQEVLIVAYRMSVALTEFNKAIENALARGCIVKIVLDRATTNETEDAFFLSLLKRYDNLYIWDFKDINSDQNFSLHAKIVAADRLKAMVGSANFSRNGMLENHEIALLVTDSAALSVCSTVDRLIKNGAEDGALFLRQRK